MGFTVWNGFACELTTLFLNWLKPWPKAWLLPLAHIQRTCKADQASWAAIV